LRARRLDLFVVSLFAVAQLDCADKSPSGPSGTAALLNQPSSGSAKAQNAPPSLVVRTTPAADYSTNPPTITVTSGAPITVFFGLCQSDDADTGDSLNWQYNFGDSGRPAFNADGTFNADTEHTCRAEHEYREGTYTAWVSVTDKHLEDQGRDVRALARRSQAFTVKAVLKRVTCGVSVNTGFEGPVVGAPAEALGIPGVSFDGGGNALLNSIPPGLAPPFANNYLTNYTPGPLRMNFESDQSSYSFSYATVGDPAIVEGFDASGNLVFTHSFPPGLGPPYPTASGSGTFRRLVLSTTIANRWAIDNLSTTAACE